MNYEDKDLTTAIDLKNPQNRCEVAIVVWGGRAAWSVGPDSGYLFVACSTQAEVLDADHNGEKLSTINTGDGVDDFYYSPAPHTLYVGAAKDARLTIARAETTGKPARFPWCRPTRVLATESSAPVPHCDRPKR